MENIIVIGTGDLYTRFLAPCLYYMQKQGLINLIATVDIKEKIDDPYFKNILHIIRKPSQKLSELLISMKNKNPVILLGHPNNLHTSDAEDLLPKGFRVMMEKPYSINQNQLNSIKKLVGKNPNKIALLDYYLMRKTIPLLILGGMIKENSFYFKTEEVLTSDLSLKRPEELNGKIKELIGEPLSVSVKILESYGEQGTLENRGSHLIDTKLGGGMIQDLGLHAIAPLFMLKEYLGEIGLKDNIKIRIAQNKNYINHSVKSYNISEEYIGESYAEIEFLTSKNIPVEIIIGKYVSEAPDQKRLVIKGTKGEFYLDLFENSAYVYAGSNKGKIIDLVNKKQERYYPIIQSGLDILKNKSPFKKETNNILLDTQKFILSIINHARKINSIKIYESGNLYYEIFPKVKSPTSKLDQLDKRDFKTYFRGYSDYLYEILNKTDTKALNRIVDILLEARKKGNAIYFIGNGGSASTASHFVADLAEVGRKLGVKVFNSISLTDNLAWITAVANDSGYEKVFSFQMQGSFKAGDVLVAISASGNSPNIIEAVKFAKEKGGIVIGLVGFDGGKLLSLSDYALHIKTYKGEYGPVEDAHLIFEHMLTSFLYYHLKGELDK